MKKRLEAELISIAHRILKLKNKSELNQLYLESRKLYETLSVLKFVEDNIHAIQPKISDNDIEKMIDHAETKIVEDDILELDKEIMIVPETGSNIEVELMLKAKPSEDIFNEKESRDSNDSETIALQNEEIVIDAEKINAKNFIDSFMDYSAEFVKKETVDADEVLLEKQTNIPIEKAEIPKTQHVSSQDLLANQIVETPFEKKADHAKAATLNEVLGKHTTFGLNDKVGFVKYLFDGSEEDFNRVISQTGTLDNADEVKNFIVDLVKPDYNNWENKGDYEVRFMDIILSRFN